MNIGDQVRIKLHPMQLLYVTDMQVAVTCFRKASTFSSLFSFGEPPASFMRELMTTRWS